MTFFKTSAFLNSKSKAFSGPDFTCALLPDMDDSSSKKLSVHPEVLKCYATLFLKHAVPLIVRSL